MAFIDQVQDLTSLTVTDTDELSQFLKDGVLDVTNKCLNARPAEIEDFVRESDPSESNASLDLNGAQIFSIVREDGVTSNNWRPCRKITTAQQHLVTDVNSLHYASKFNPAYMIGDNGKVSVFPAPGSDPNTFKAYYVNNSPEESGGSALSYTSTSIKYFPNDKVYLVVMYAGIKLLHATMSNNVISVNDVAPVSPTIGTVSFSVANDLIVSAVVPTAPSAPSFTYTDVSISDIINPLVSISDMAALDESAPIYVPPTRTAVAFSDYTTGLSETDPSILEEEEANLPGEEIQMTAYVVDAINDANTYFDDEDPEMVGAALQRAAAAINKYNAIVSGYGAEVSANVQEYAQKLNQYKIELDLRYQAWAKTESDNLQKYQVDIQNNLHKFNQDNVTYQQDIQRKVQNLQKNVQNVQNDIAVKGSNLNKDIQIGLQNAIQDFQQDVQEYSAKIQKYNSELNNYGQIVGKDLQSYTAQLQADIQEMNSTIENNRSLLSKYQSDTASYQASVAANIQEQSVKMQQYQLLYSQLKLEYDGAFLAMYPSQQPAAQPAVQQGR